MYKVTNTSKYDQIIYPDGKPTLVKSGETVTVNRKPQGNGCLVIEEKKEKPKKEVKENGNNSRPMD